MAQFAGTHKQHWGQFQGALDYECAFETVNRTEQLTNASWFSDRCEMASGRCGQCPSKIACRIAFSPASGDGVSKYLSNILVRPVRRIQSASAFDSLHH
jgi:hypothetical protein